MSRTISERGNEGSRITGGEAGAGNETTWPRARLGIRFGTGRGATRARLRPEIGVGFRAGETAARFWVGNEATWPRARLGIGFEGRGET